MSNLLDLHLTADRRFSEILYTLCNDKNISYTGREVIVKRHMLDWVISLHNLLTVIFLMQGSTESLSLSIVKLNHCTLKERSCFQKSKLFPLRFYLLLLKADTIQKGAKNARPRLLTQRPGE